MNKTSPYLSQYCYRSSVKLMMELGRDEWMAQMRRNYHRVYPGKPGPSELAAWENEYDVLCDTFLRLPEQYRKLQIIFEFVMPGRRWNDPNERGCRSDAILLSKNTVTVLEFKRLDATWVGCERQAKKYYDRIHDRHRGSQGMYKRAVAVLTEGQDIMDNAHYVKKVKICSPDRLAEVIAEVTDAQKMSQQGVKQWLASEWYFEGERPVKSGDR